MSAPRTISFRIAAEKVAELDSIAKDLDAELIVLQGQLVDARIGDLRGMPALAEIIDCQEGSFELLPVSDSCERSLQGPWQNLVLSAAQQIDERSFPRIVLV